MLYIEAREQDQPCLSEMKFTEVEFNGDPQNCVIKLKFCFIAYYP